MQKRRNFIPCHDKQDPLEEKKLQVDGLSGNCKILYLLWSYTSALEVDRSLSILKSHPFLQLVPNSFAPLESDFEIRLI